MRIEIFDEPRASAHMGCLAEILRDAVRDGALVGYVLPFDSTAATAYWRNALQSVGSGERVLFCAHTDERVVGTVQLYLSPEPNAPHRGEVFKLLVHPAYRRNSMGEALMRAVEDEARRQNRSLLLLDTVEGGAGERLYRKLGWQEIGRVPNHFVDPHGVPQTSVYFMRTFEKT